jgi:hypothetical protein
VKQILEQSSNIVWSKVKDLEKGFDWHCTAVVDFLLVDFSRIESILLHEETSDQPSGPHSLRFANAARIF